MLPDQVKQWECLEYPLHCNEFAGVTMFLVEKNLSLVSQNIAADMKDINQVVFFQKQC